MNGPKGAKELLRYYFGRYQEEIVRLLSKVVLNRTLSDDAGKLQGNTVAQLLQPARDELAAHIADLDNPHEETLASLGTSSETYIRELAASKIPNGIVPISTYGVSDRLTDAQVAAAWTYSGWILTCNRAIIAIISGQPVTLPITSIDLRNIEAAPANKTFHLYVYMKYNVITYRCTTETPPEGVSIMYIGTVTTNSSGIATKSFKRVIRLDTFRLSVDPRGSVIPVTGGTVDAVTKLPSGWNPL